jgi:hypothetical protein
MIEIIQAIVSFAFIVGFAALAVALFKLKTLNTQLFHLSQQLSSDNKVLALEINKVTATEAYDGQDGFIKFISQSRDWAFEYIENVQLTIKTFKDTVEPIAIKHKGDSEARIEGTELEKLLAAYVKLVSELPDDSQATTRDERRKK